MRYINGSELAVYLEALETVRELPLTVSGSSMIPFLADRRDTVYLTRVDRPLRRGDLVLYRRKTGDYVLHRICGRDREGYSMVGDAQSLVETGISEAQILARVCRVRRKGREQRPGDLLWFFFERIWIRLIPLRPRLLRWYARLRHFGRAGSDPA